MAETRRFWRRFDTRARFATIDGRHPAPRRAGCGVQGMMIIKKTGSHQLPVTPKCKGQTKRPWEAVMGASAPQFMFDFGSPNAFLSHEAIPAIEKRIGMKFEYVPVLLGGIFKATNNKSPAETLAGVKNKREFHAIETERFVKRFQANPCT